MGFGFHEKGDDPENPQSDEDEQAAERRKLNEQEGIELKKLPPRPTETTYPEVIIGHPKPFMKTSHLKYALLFFNCILALLGLTILVLAVWVRVDPEFWQYDKTLKIESFYTVCHMLIATGLILLLVAFVGCFASVVESQWMLTAYFVIYTLIFIIQLAAAVMIWTEPYNKKLGGILESAIKTQVDQVESDDSSRYFMDFLQQNLKCCGSKSQHDYSIETPNSCDNPRTGYVFAEGCAASLINYLRSKAGIIGGVSAPILLIQLISLVLCYCLIYNLRKESRYSI